MNRILASLITVCATWLVAAFPAWAGYVFTTINSPNTNNHGVHANGISPAGVVVGNFTDVSGVSHGFTYNPDTVAYTTYDYPGASGTSLYGVNNSGELVGTFYTPSSSFGFIDSGGTTQVINPGGFTTLTTATSINSSGQIVGDIRGDIGAAQAYIGDPVHGYTTMSPTGAHFSEAFGVNDAGTVVGGYDVLSGASHGFVATKGSSGFYTTTSLDYPGATGTYGEGINSAGTIVGIFSNDNFNTFHGFLDTNGKFTQFDVPGSKPGSTGIWEINNAGQLVGQYVPAGSSTGYPVGFLATPTVCAWTGTASANWADSGNWDVGVPGATTGITNTVTAVFNQSAPHSPLTIDASRNIQNITFDSAGVNSLTVGTVGGQALLLTAAGTIQSTSTVIAAQTINAPLVLERDYTFASGASSSSATLRFGGRITPGATSGIATLTLNGVNTGANTISGVVADNGSGQLAVSMNGTGVWILSGANTYSGGTTVLSGTLTTTGGGSIGSGPLVVSAADTVTSLVNIGNSQTVSGLSGTLAGSGSARVNIAGGTTLAVSQSGNTTFAGTLVNSGTVAKTDIGTLEFDGAPTLNNNSSLQANGGTLRFNVNSGTATIGTGVTATVASGATLELAGSVSVLSSGSNRVDITNDSQQTSGGMLVVSGTNQQVGAIDGAGDTVVNAGSDLTANHIIQSALVIGGTAGSPALVTIDASDASGNPLGQSSGFVLASSLSPSDPLGVDGISSANLSSGAGGGTDLAALSLGSSPGFNNPSSVPEPSTLLLAFLAALGVVSTQFARHHLRSQTV